MSCKPFPRSILALILALILAFGGTVAAFAADAPLEEDGGTLQQFPETSRDTEIQLGYHNLLKNDNGDLEYYYKVVYSGMFDISMTYGSLSGRDYRMYIPEDSRYSQPSIFLMVPSETDPYTFMVDSGWKAVADQEKATIFLLMPDRVKDEQGVATAWGTWGNYDEVAAYISAAVSVAGQRPGIQTVSYCYYALGYGDAADYMTKFVMNNPTTFAGAFVIGDTLAFDSDLATALQAAESAEEGVMKSEIAVPFGMITGANTAPAGLVSYFKTANQSAVDAVSNGSFIHYPPADDAVVRIPDSEAVAGVYVKTGTEVSQSMSEALAGEIFGIFEAVRRYPGYSNTELRYYEDVYTSNNYEYYDSLSALGRYTYGGDINAQGDGENYNREWWLYVPESAKDRMASGEKVETMFVFMGSNGYGDEAPQRTGWSKIADEEGFIIVSPSGHVRHQGNFGNFTQNGVNVYHYCTNWTTQATAVLPNDLILIEDIHEWLFNDSPYADGLDSSRVYASGQSAGGSFTHNVAKNLPHLFAAAAPSSWVADGGGADESSDIAMVVMMGQKDTTISGALGTSSAQRMFDYYIERYGNLTDAEGRSSWSDFTFMEEYNGTGTSVCTKSEGPFNQYILQTENGVPMFVGLEVVGLTHATVPTECTFAWDIMKGFSKNSDGVLYYEGAEVDTPLNKSGINLTTNAHNIQPGDYIELNTAFRQEQKSNAVILNYTYDSNVFEFEKFATAGNVRLVDTQSGDGYAKITLMIADYNAEELGELTLRAKEDAPLNREKQTVQLTAEYVLKDDDGEKTINEAAAKVSFTSIGPGLLGDTNDDGVVDLIDLSNMVDWFGLTSNDPGWDDWYTYFDFNNNGEIDIQDIVCVAQLI